MELTSGVGTICLPPASTGTGRRVRARSHRLAAQSALQDDAAALVVDVAGPVPFVIEGDDLRALAAGWTLARVGERAAWIGPAPE